MKSPVSEAIAAMRAEEELRQERETFDQNRVQHNRWFRLRLTVGYTSIVLLAAIMGVTSVILFTNTQFPADVVTLAASTLFGDVVGLLIAVWKLVLNPGSLPSLQPVTRTGVGSQTRLPSS